MRPCPSRDSSAASPVPFLPYPVREWGGVAEAVRRDAGIAHGGPARDELKVGYPTVAEDIAVVRARARGGGDDLTVMVDYNQSLSVPEATARLHALYDERLTWAEEPASADDLAGHAKVAAERGPRSRRGRTGGGRTT